MYVLESERDRSLNPIVALDVAINDLPAGRLIIELRADIVPRTCENFRRLCTGETISQSTGIRRHFAQCPIHRIVKGKYCQSGDFMNRNGTGGECAINDATLNNRVNTIDNDAGYMKNQVFEAPLRATFEDENFILQHTGPGVLSMVNSGPDTNTSQFYLHFQSTPEMNGKHVVFGVLLGDESFQVLSALDTIATERGNPKYPAIITMSGQLYP